MYIVERLAGKTWKKTWWTVKGFPNPFPVRIPRVKTREEAGLALRRARRAWPEETFRVTEVDK